VASGKQNHLRGCYLMSEANILGTAYLNAVSNRLAASSNRARLLGMIIGTGISELIEVLTPNTKGLPRFAYPLGQISALCLVPQ
jgi:hypothetical protein